MDSSSTNISLLSRIRDGSDDAAWREFDGRYREMMQRYCRRRGLPQIDAEDVVQSTFTGLSQSLKRFTYDANRGRFRDYLYRYVRGEISKWSARPQAADRALFNHDGRALVDEVAQSDGEIDALWEEEWVAHHYRRALVTIRESFDPRSVEVFDRSIAGAGVELLATEYGMTEQAVYKVRKRIRDRLEEVIAEQIREEDDVDGLAGD
jgi:RNA polymerase sigma factor (sigma-70 family)